MKSPLVLAMLTVTCVAAPAAAQTVSAQVTLKVPINLTQLGPDVSKVQLGCSIISDAITNGNTNSTLKTEIAKSQEIPVAGGQVVTTGSLVFDFTQLDNPVGKSARISCTLNGWSASQQTWIQFTPNQANTSFRTNVTVGFVDGSFIW